MNKLAIGEVCNVIKGKIGIAKAIPGEYPLVATRSERLSHNELQFDCKAVCVPLVSSTGHGHASIKRIHYQEGKFALGSILVAITSKDENILDTKFLYIYLSTLKDRILVPLMQGTANVTMSVKVIKDAMIDLPSIEKQRKIVKTYQYILPIWESLIELYEDQQSLINNARESILQLAMQGKLVRQDENDEPAAVLLEKIKDEKERLVKEGKIRKSKPLPSVEMDEIRFKIPSTWNYVRLNDVFDVRDGTHDSPKYIPTGIPLITSKNLSSGRLDFTNVKYISEEDHSKISERSKVNEYDILFAMIGSIGNPVIVDNVLEFSIKNVALFKYYNFKLSVPRFIFYFLIQASHNMREQAAGGVQSFVSLGYLRNYIFPLPPLQEQRRIVAKVDQLMALCDELEAKLNQSQTDGAKLMEAVVAGLVGV